MSWIVLGERVAGTAHRSRNTPCQDAFGVTVVGDWLVVAVADGAGSASHADIGASRACDTVIRHAETAGSALPGTVEHLAELMTAARVAVLADAAVLSLPPRELACTLLVAAVGPEVTVVAQVGDGAVVAGDGTDYRVAVWPEPTGYANCTDFLTNDLFPAVLKQETLTGPVTELAAFTDGLQRLALDFAARRAHTDFFRPMFAAVREASDPAGLVDPLRAFLDSDRVNARTDDDKTLVLAVRRP